MGSIGNTARVWLITGCSSGFGREIAAAAAKIGDIVVATSRDPAKLGDLKKAGAGKIIPQALDVGASDDQVKARIADIVSTVGRIDILINNAGYILEGAVEECSTEEVEEQYKINVFAQMRVLRAVLPYMRSQRSGIVANLGSIGGWRGTAAAGLYCSSKAAIGIYTESLSLELAEFGIETTCIEPGYFRTNFLESSANRVTAKNQIPELKGVTQGARDALKAYNHKQPGDPVKGAQVIVEALTRTGRCQGRTLPVRLSLGKDAYGFIGECLDRERAALEAWKDVTTTTDH